MKTIIAIIIYKLGFRPNCSTFIDEITTTYGYGKLSDMGLFNYPLPNEYMEFSIGMIVKWTGYDPCIGRLQGRTKYIKDCWILSASHDSCNEIHLLRATNKERKLYRRSKQSILRIRLPYEPL